MWAIIGEAPSKKRGYVLAKCQCGTVSERPKWNILNNHSRSCGCNTLELQKAPRKFGPSDPDPLVRLAYRIYMGMLTRCKATKGRLHKYYSGRGIRVCERWSESFENFFKDMGKPPTLLHSIDRVNNDLGYNPSNCRWATYQVQAENRRNARIITHDGVTKNLYGWARETGIEPSAIISRIYRGWPEGLAATTPPLSHDKRKGRRNRVQFTHLIENEASVSSPQKAPTHE